MGHVEISHLHYKDGGFRLQRVKEAQTMRNNEMLVLPDCVI